MVEMIRLADEPWAPVAQGHTGAEVVRSVRVALRGTNEKITQAPGRLVRPEAKVRELDGSFISQPTGLLFVCSPVGSSDRKHRFIS